MTRETATGRERFSKVRRYRRLYWVAFGVGVVGFFAGLRLGYPLVAVGVYYAGFLGMLAVWKGTSVQLFDERERELERRASYYTISVFGIVLILGSPGQIVVEALGYTVPPAFQTAMWAYAALFAVFGVVYLALRYRP